MTLLSLKGSIALLTHTPEKQIGVLTTQIKLKDLLKLYRIDPDVNRDISNNRIPKLVKYIDNYTVTPGIFFPSIVFAYTGDLTKDFDKDISQLNIKESGCLLIIDGQHRIKALEKYIQDTRVENIKKETVLNTDFTIQIYFGMNKDDMRNLFADINSNSIKVSMSLITSYDSREIVNILTKELYDISPSLQGIGVEFKKSRITRPQNKTFITSARLKKFISILLFGKAILTNKEEMMIKNQYDEMISFLDKFFIIFCNSIPREPGDSIRYILGHEAVQKALALILHESIFENKNLSLTLNWEEQVEVIKHIDWSINNILWAKFLIKVKEKTVHESYSVDIKQEKPILKVMREEYKTFVK